MHTAPNQHDFTVTVYIVRLDSPESTALLHIHKKHGKLLSVGGHIELNETPWQAAAHEIFEESGYGLEQLMVLQPPQRFETLPRVKLHPYPLVLNTHDIPPNHFHSDIIYGFVATGEPQGVPGQTESDDLRWLTQVELAEITEPDIFLNTKTVYDFMFSVCLPTWDRVPANTYEL